MPTITLHFEGTQTVHPQVSLFQFLFDPPSDVSWAQLSLNAAAIPPLFPQLLSIYNIERQLALNWIQTQHLVVVSERNIIQK